MNVSILEKVGKGLSRTATATMGKRLSALSRRLALRATRSLTWTRPSCSM